MKTLAAFAILMLTVAPAARAQATNLTGKWTGTMSSDGGSGEIFFTMTQKGKVLTGTGGPSEERQWKIEKGVVNGAKVSFQIQQADGPLFTFTLTLAKGHLQGDMNGVRPDGTKRAFKVDVTKAK